MMSASGSTARRAEVVRFIGVGAAGFLTDALVLTLLLRAGQSVLISRVCSFACASFVTWWLHRVYTFTQRNTQAQSKGGQYVRYILVQIVGALTNLAVFLAVVHWFPALLRWPIVPLAIGAGPGLAVSFIGSSAWAFKARDAGRP